MRRTIARAVAVLPVAAVPLAAIPAVALEAKDLVGRWGLASYFDEKDAAHEEAAARSECHSPYVIGRGSSGGVMMHLPDEPKAHELMIKSGAGGTFIGPAGEAGGKLDRAVVRFDGKVLVLKWLDPSVGNRYGIMVFVRCGK